MRIVDANQSYHLIIVAIEAHTDHTGRDTSHRADIVLIEAYGTSVAVGKQQFVVTIGQANAYHLVTLVDVDGDHTGSAYILISCETGLLDDTLLRGEHHIVGIEELFVVEVLDTQYGVDRIVGIDVEHILDGTAL